MSEYSVSPSDGSVPLIDPNNHADFPVQPLAPGMSVQWLDGGRIYLMRPMRDSAQIFQSWEAVIKPLMDHWPIDRLFCALYDLRSPDLVITLQTGTQLRRITHHYRTVHNASAYVYRPRSQVAAVMQVRKVLPPASPQDKSGFFHDYDQAIAWLQDQFAAWGTLPQP